MQAEMVAQGYDYRVSKAIRRKDENGQAYDVTEKLRLEMHYFPFGGKKDAVDAFSRIYDMEPKAPNYREPSYAEPEWS
jgi:hypothetical protein